MSALTIGLCQSCPRCGKASLYQGVLTVRENCPACGLDLSARDPGDGPAFFVITLLGFLVIVLAVIVDNRWHPPLWVHALLWIPFVSLGAILLLRIAKALLIAYQYHLKIGFKHHEQD